MTGNQPSRGELRQKRLPIPPRFEPNPKERRAPLTHPPPNPPPPRPDLLVVDVASPPAQKPLRDGREAQERRDDLRPLAAPRRRPLDLQKAIPPAQVLVRRARDYEPSL